jgi:hypothetical protein
VKAALASDGLLWHRPGRRADGGRAAHDGRAGIGAATRFGLVPLIGLVPALSGCGDLSFRARRMVPEAAA